MKKYNSFLLLTLGAALLLTSCKDKDIEREPSPVFNGTAEVYFPDNSITEEYDPALGIVESKIAISRKDSVGELKVAIVVVENDSDVFQLKDTFVFADKVKTDSILIRFPKSKDGIKYNLKLTVSDAMINPYSKTVSECNFSFIKLKWEKSKVASVWEDNSWKGMWGLPTQKWYVHYEYVLLSDGSAKYRFLNPYASHPSNWDPSTKEGKPDRYGVYDGFPSNYPGDYDTENPYNAVASVTKDGKVSWETFATGVDWDYGMMYIGNCCIAFEGCSEEEYPLGTFKDGVISFPDNSMFVADDEGGIPGGSCTITLDSMVYQKAHSVKHIADYEKGFNDDTEMQWNIVNKQTSIFESEAFSESWDVVLRKAVDIDSINGAKSEFRNLYSFADLYENDFCLAFYWDQEKGKITIPDNQPTGKTFASTQIFAGPSSKASTIEEVSVSGTTLTKITLGVALTSGSGGLIGQFDEVFYMGDKINWSIDSYVGAYVVQEESAFGYGPNLDTVVISKINKDSALIRGLDFCSGLIATFNAATTTLSLAPQEQDSIFGTYDISFLTLDDEGVSDTEPIVFQMGLDGKISFAPNTGAYGYLLYSEAYEFEEPDSYGYIDAYYDQVLTPITLEPSAISARKVAKAHFTKHGALKPVAHKAGKNLSTKGFSIKGKAPRYFRQTSNRVVLF